MDTHIPCIKSVTSSSPSSHGWSSFACAATIAHIIHFFFICINGTDLLCLRPHSNRLVLVATLFLNLPRIVVLRKL